MVGKWCLGSFTCRKEGRRAEDFLSPFKNPTASAGFEPANLGIRGQHATSVPPKPLFLRVTFKNSNNQLDRKIMIRFVEEGFLWVTTRRGILGGYMTQQQKKKKSPI